MALETHLEYTEVVRLLFRQPQASQDFHQIQFVRNIHVKNRVEQKMIHMAGNAIIDYASGEI
jgi:hypothetical protein